jgi:hypothetical protein
MQAARRPTALAGAAPCAFRYAVHERPAQHRRDCAHTGPDHRPPQRREPREAEHLLRPRRQQVDPGVHHQRGGRPQRRLRERRVQQDADHFERARAGFELGLHAREIGGDLRARARHGLRAEALGDLRGFRVIAILTFAAQRRIHIAQMRGQEARYFRDMHPREQRRIVGAVRAAVGRGARYARVNGLHALDQRERVRAIAERGARYERRRAAQAAEDVGAGDDGPRRPPARADEAPATAARRRRRSSSTRNPHARQQTASGPNSPGSPGGDE